MSEHIPRSMGRHRQSDDGCGWAEWGRMPAHEVRYWPWPLRLDSKEEGDGPERPN